MASFPACLDTSVVLRLLVGQPLDQYQVAMSFLSEAVTKHQPVHVSDLVLAEAYFALQGHYHLPKADALKALELFIKHSGVTASPVATRVLGQPNLASAKPGFVDRLIHGICHAEGLTLVTFEKAARRLPSTHLLLPQ